MRKALIIGAALLVALAVAAPHLHRADPIGSHGCLACVFGAGEVAPPAACGAAPALAASGEVPRASALAPSPGFPLGAVSGQSPPRA